MAPNRRWAVSARELTLSTNRTRLLTDASFTIQRGTKAALIGRNGGGKSSLLAALVSTILRKPLPSHMEVGGQLRCSPGVRAVLVPQEVALGWPGTVAEYLGGRVSWTSPNRHSEVLAEFQVDESWGDRLLRSLSGGEANRVALAAAWLADADLILLDEPTNHLDFAGQEAVTTRIRESRAAVLVVSHDRELLAQAIGEIWEIDEQQLTLHQYPLGYQGYLDEKRRQFEAASRGYQEQERTREKLAHAAATLSLRADSYEQRSTDSSARRKARKIARVAASQRSRIDRELKSLVEPMPPLRPRLLVKQAEVKEGQAIALLDCALGFPGQTALVRSLSLRVRHGRRYGLVGPNGGGKSTLLSLISGALQPLAGTVERAPHLATAGVTQTPDVDRLNQSVVERSAARTLTSLEEAGAILGMVLFRDCSRTRASELSLGELRRVDLAGAFGSGAGLLLLDEPSNHLDVPSLEMVDCALAEYRGAVVVVSHDRRLLGSIGLDELWMIRAGEFTRWELGVWKLEELLAGLHW